MLYGAKHLSYTIAATLLLSLLISIPFTGCVKREPRTEQKAEENKKKQSSTERCGLICRLKKENKKGKPGPEGHKKDSGGGGWFSGKDTSSHRGKGVYHTVKKGETLWRICHTYGVDLNEVARVNGIKDTTSLSVGQRLWIPGADTVMNVPPPPASYGGGIKSSPGRSSPSPPPTRSATRGTLSHPMPGSNITSGFGTRDGRMHEGIDFQAPPGTSVLAADDGKVVYSDDAIRGYGNMIIVKHAGNLTTVYAHNKRNLVNTGDFVKRGEKIAEAGTSGRVNASHGAILHFEVRVGEKAVNPALYLP